MALKNFSPNTDKQAQLTPKNRLPGWRRIFFGVRTRILALYIVLMACSTMISILAIRQLLLLQLQQQVEKFLVQKVKEFRRLTKGRNPTTAEPFGDDIAAIFDVFLSRNIPHEDAFLITLLNGKFYKSSPYALPDNLQPDSGTVARQSLPSTIRRNGSQSRQNYA